MSIKANLNWKLWRRLARIRLYRKQELVMNHPTMHHPARHWLKDAQFAVGVIVAVGGAAVLLSEIVRWLA
jgi:hypothetical protein